MTTLVNFVAGYWQLWILSAVLSFVLMAVFGTKWEKSGRRSEDRKPYLIFFSQFFGFILGVSALLAVISLLINFLRAI